MLFWLNFEKPSRLSGSFYTELAERSIYVTVFQGKKASIIEFWHLLAVRQLDLAVVMMYIMKDD